LEIEGSAPQGLKDQLTIIVAGHQEGRCVGRERPNLTQKVQPVHARHANIRHDRIVIGDSDPAQRVLRPTGRFHAKAGHLNADTFRQRLAVRRIVVYDKDPPAVVT
jgi:hypothetical protein